MTKHVCILALLAVSATPVVAICPHPIPKVCSAFFESDVVFVGSVLSQHRSGADDYIRYDVTVSRTLRGSLKTTAAIYTGDDSGRLLLEVGREYVIFARREGARLISVEHCAPLSDATKVPETLRQIEALQRATPATIEGEVVSAQPDGPGVLGVLVQAHHGERTYSATSDAQGIFQIAVPPGRYQVVRTPPLRQSDYNLWVNRNDIHLVAGQCAQLQFVSR